MKQSTIDLSPFPNNIAKVLEYEASTTNFDISKVKLDNQKRIIRISGLAGSGKGTISTKISELLHIGHLETSGILRAATWIYTELGLDFNDENTRIVFEKIKLKHENLQLQIFWEDQLLTNLELRSNQVQTKVAIFSGDQFFRACYYDKVSYIIENFIDSTIILDGRGFNTPYIKLAENLGFEVIKLFFWVSQKENYKRYAKAYLERNNLEPNSLEISLNNNPVLINTIQTEFQKNMVDRNYQDYENDIKNNLESITSDSWIVNTSDLTPDQIVQMIMSKFFDVQK